MNYVWDGSTNISLHTGKHVNVPFPLPEQVDVRDVAHCLSNTCRFGGRTRYFFSVAQHGFETALLCYVHAKRFNVDPIKAAKCGLAHDNKEYAIGDVTSPLKAAIEANGGGYKVADRHMNGVINEAFGLGEIMLETKACWQWADLEMLISDAMRWEVFGNFNIGGTVYQLRSKDVVPPPFKLRFSHHTAWQPYYARQQFLWLYEMLNKPEEEAIWKIDDFIKYNDPRKELAC